MGVKFVSVGKSTSQAGIEYSLRQKMTRALETRRKILQCVLVKVEGEIQVTGRPAFVWVREYANATATTGGVFQVFCPPGTVEYRQNLPVFVGPSPKAPYRLQVLGVDFGMLANLDDYNGGGYVLGKHGKTHTFLPGMPHPDWSTDVADITTRNLVDGRVKPTDPASMQCVVATCQYFNKNGTLRIFGRSLTKDFTADVPAGAGDAVLMYVCINGATNALEYITSTAFEWLTFADPVPNTAIATIPDGLIVLSAIILNNGLTAITEDQFRYEVRPIFRANSGGIPVDLAAATDHDMLTYDAASSEWKHVTRVSLDLGDFGSDSAAAGYVPTADGAGGITWAAQAGGTGSGGGNGGEPLVDETPEVMYGEDDILMTGASGSGGGSITRLTGTTKIVGVGDDFATITAGLQWFADYNIGNDCYLRVDPGTYTEAVQFNELLITGDYFSITGDMRTFAGYTFGHQVEMGLGRAATVPPYYHFHLSDSGNDLVIDASGISVDLASDGWVAGDEVIVRDNTGALTTHTIASTSWNAITWTQTITFGDACPNVGSVGSTATMKPNCSISAGASRAVTSLTHKIRLRGFYIYGTAAESVVLGSDGVNAGGQLELENCVVTGGTDTGIYCASHNSQLYAHTVTVLNCTTNFYAWQGTEVQCQFCWAIGGSMGFLAEHNSQMFLSSCSAVAQSDGFGTGSGFRAAQRSYISAESANTVGCEIGFAASNQSGIYAPNSSGRAVSNGDDYDPNQGDAENSTGSMIWS